ncbi:Las17-binding protein actin regulator [Poseidonocella pacifica]|uniref:Las17-binding protein actin regulator n=1 Tax=Poseidonocella pacifica TaxID=871651 RepID=A0A1I0WKJ1_9RHOB|nr:YSC84-related protein [Poseidonocella pacifica]SFA88466.1 Las17-binding protein actin regulator [Poseidonocella pacifica]
MSRLNRRSFTLGTLGMAGLLAACNNGVGAPGAASLDARVDSTLSYLYSKFPGTRDLGDKSAGQLVMPLVTEAGLGIGGSFGRGALRVGGTTVDYYSATTANFGLQVGAQQYAHVLFFMTDEALMRFRRSPGWALGADVEYVVQDRGENMRADTNTTSAPVIAVVFGQAGLRIGATLEGTKYSRIIP